VCSDLWEIEGRLTGGSFAVAPMCCCQVADGISRETTECVGDIEESDSWYLAYFRSVGQGLKDMISWVRLVSRKIRLGCCIWQCLIHAVVFEEIDCRLYCCLNVCDLLLNGMVVVPDDLVLFCWKVGMDDCWVCCAWSGGS